MSMMSTRIQEVYSLAAWYNDVLKRYEQLAAWTTGNLVTPASVWLSGLFNPKAFLTAVSSTTVFANAACLLQDGSPAVHKLLRTCAAI
jgi:dynein heavy chain